MTTPETFTHCAACGIGLVRDFDSNLCDDCFENPVRREVRRHLVRAWHAVSDWAIASGHESSELREQLEAVADAIDVLDRYDPEDEL